MQAKTSHSIARLKDDILSALNSLRAEMEKIETEQESYTISKRGAKVSELAERGQLMAKATEVLRSLHFPGMESRHTRIVKAHYETCQWAWKAHFRQWMTSSDFLFWVRVIGNLKLYRYNINVLKG